MTPLVITEKKIEQLKKNIYDTYAFSSDELILTYPHLKNLDWI